MTVRLKNCRILCDGYKENTVVCDTVSGLILPADTEAQVDEDLHGAFLLPAFTDIGCGFFDPKFPRRDTLRTASAAADAGGYRRLITLDPLPVKDNDTRVKNAQKLPENPEKVAENGIFYRYNSDNSELLPIFTRVAEKNGLVVSAGIDGSSTRGSFATGTASRITSTVGISRYDECAELARELFAAYESGCRLHVRAIASREALYMIKEAKKQGVKVTCGVSPFHIALTESDVAFYGHMCKLLPPLRGRSDREALREGLLNGDIDCVASLHTPLTREEKSSEHSPFGLSSIENTLQTVLTYVPEIISRSPKRLGEIFAIAPSRIIGECHTVAVGQRADMVVLSPDTEVVVTENTLRSKSLNTPFLGQTLVGSLQLYLGGIRI